MSKWTKGGADIDGAYRYQLWREWGPGPTCAFVMLNPSTADAEQDDPTIRRCLGFAKSWGHGRLVVVNIYPLRATDPAELNGPIDPYGPPGRNEAAIESAAQEASFVVAAWGATRHRTPAAQRAIRAVTKHRDLYRLRATKDGAPAHPLYLPASVGFHVWCAKEPS